METTLQSTTITEREKAAIRLHVFGNVDDWRLLYTLAGGKQGGTPATTTHYISKWKNAPKVASEIEAQKREKFAADEAIKERLREEIRREEERQGSEAPERATRRRVDYANPDEQKRLLNDLINGTNDPDQKLDALKIIIAGQRDDRQAAKEGRQVRAYLPQNCRDCVLYQREKAKQEKKTK